MMTTTFSPSLPFAEASTSAPITSRILSATLAAWQRVTTWPARRRRAHAAAHARYAGHRAQHFLSLSVVLDSDHFHAKASQWAREAWRAALAASTCE